MFLIPQTRLRNVNALHTMMIIVKGSLSMLTNRMNVRIGWGDCDPAGIVFYPRYFAFFNEATGALFESIGYPKPLLLKTFGLVGYPLVEASATFSRPCTFGDDVVIETSIAEWGRTSFKLRHRLLKGDALCVECHEKHVWAARDPANPTGIRSKVIPDEIKALLS
jgi:4-hydroxybenzoyl-CoA thioesterase